MAQHAFPKATGQARPPYRRVIGSYRRRRHVEAYGETRDYEYVHEQLDCGHEYLAGTSTDYIPRAKRPCHQCRNEAEQGATNE